MIELKLIWTMRNSVDYSWIGKNDSALYMGNQKYNLSDPYIVKRTMHKHIIILPIDIGKIGKTNYNDKTYQS